MHTWNVLSVSAELYGISTVSSRLSNACFTTHFTVVDCKKQFINLRFVVLFLKILEFWNTPSSFRLTPIPRPLHPRQLCIIYITTVKTGYSALLLWFVLQNMLPYCALSYFCHFLPRKATLCQLIMVWKQVRWGKKKIHYNTSVTLWDNGATKKKATGF